jgi:hypothetical protein
VFSFPKQAQEAPHGPGYITDEIIATVVYLRPDSNEGLKERPPRKWLDCPNGILQ